MFSKNYIFTGKVNVGVAVGAALATLLVAIIIVVVGYWFPKFKSEKSQVMSYKCRRFYTVEVIYILNLNKKIHCFARKFT